MSYARPKQIIFTKNNADKSRMSFVLRVTHDGTVTKYNNPDQMNQRVTDLDSLGFSTTESFLLALYELNNITAIDMLCFHNR